VLAFVSDVLSAPVKISGQPVANLVASTSGTDSDWVVKVIDVYPDEVASQPEMGGYQLMVSADIFRGRYRESLETAKAIPAGEPLPTRSRFRTRTTSSCPATGSWCRSSRAGSRSTTAIRRRSFQYFLAKPEDYRAATQRVYHAPGKASFVELPIVVTGP
jgi:predicted acyl esterase